MCVRERMRKVRQHSIIAAVELKEKNRVSKSNNACELRTQTNRSIQMNQ